MFLLFIIKNKDLGLHLHLKNSQSLATGYRLLKGMAKGENIPIKINLNLNNDPFSNLMSMYPIIIGMIIIIIIIIVRSKKAPDLEPPDHLRRRDFN